MWKLLSMWFLPIPLAIFLGFIFWDLLWRGMALWRSARNKQKVWFIALLIINSVGILPIVYLIFFSGSKVSSSKASQNKQDKKE